MSRILEEVMVQLESYKFRVFYINMGYFGLLQRIIELVGYVGSSE